MPDEKPPVEEAKQPEFEVESAGRNVQEEPKEEVKPKEEEKPNDGEKKEVGTEDQPKKKNRSQKRIETLSREKRELQKELDELKVAKEEEPVELNPDDFENYDEYLEAVENHAEKKPTEKAPVKNDDGFQEVLDSIEVKFDDSRDKYEDFDELVKKQPADGGPHITLSMVEAMEAVDNSGEVAYTLAKDVDDSIRISKLSPIKQVLAIQKLSDKIAKTEQKQTPVKPTTKAPEPINPLGGGEVDQKSLANAENFSDYSKMREEENSSSNGW